MRAQILLSTTLMAGGSWNFDADSVGRLPKGWETRGRSALPVYQIQAEPDGNRYLAAESRDSDVQLGVEVEAKPQEFPILFWRWRAWELPAGADERKSKTLDSAAAVYAVFGSRLFPRILKYVWSTAVPSGTSFKHPSSGRMEIIVVRSGTGSRGQWQQVTRDLVGDYKAAFGSSPPNLIAIGVKTDSDSTHTLARADYDDIRLQRR
jgi:Protein of unknown function (DUF3047)